MKNENNALTMILQYLDQPLYYAIIKYASIGEIIYVKKSESYPQYIIFHPDDAESILNSFLAVGIIIKPLSEHVPDFKPKMKVEYKPRRW